MLALPPAAPRLGGRPDPPTLLVRMIFLQICLGQRICQWIRRRIYPWIYQRSCCLLAGS